MQIKGKWTPVLVAASAIILAVAGAAQADLNGHWDLTIANVDSYQDGLTYGTVDVATAGNVVTVTVDGLNPGNLKDGSGNLIDPVLIGKFGFNLAPSLISTAQGAWTLPTGWDFVNGDMDGFGNFTVKIADEQNPADPLEFSFTTLVDPTTLNFASTHSTLGDCLFAAHIRGDGLAATFFAGQGTPTVPAPGAALLVCLGLGLVGWMKRRLA